MREAAGLITAQRLEVGELVTQLALQKPVVVRRGDTLMVRYMTDQSHCWEIEIPESSMRTLPADQQTFLRRQPRVLRRQDERPAALPDRGRQRRSFAGLAAAERQELTR